MLGQLQACGCLADKLRVDRADERSVQMLIGRVPESRCIRLLVEETWNLCSGSGFIVRPVDNGVEVEMIALPRVQVSASGISASVETVGIDSSGGVAEDCGEDDSLRQVNAMLTALHEIKNRVLAYPEEWRVELNHYARGLSDAVRLMRAPEIRRLQSSRLFDLCNDAVREAQSAYGGSGKVDVLVEDESVYSDDEMVRIVIRNLASNAARAASEAKKSEWGIEGTISAHELDLVVWNRCEDISLARQSLESRQTRTRSGYGTGSGLPIIRRLIGKMLGRLDFQYLTDEVRARVLVPVDLMTVSGLLDVKVG
jgi:hypothetical protein